MARLKGAGTIIDASESEEERRRERSREGRLIAVIVVVVVSWLITRMWANTFDIFARKVLKVREDSLVANTIVSLLFTIIIVWILLSVGIDDLFSS